MSVQVVPPRRAELEATLAPRHAVIAVQWEQALARTGFVPASVPEVQVELQRLVERVVAALLAEPVDREAGRRIGAALAGMHYVAPEALERTQELLAGTLIDGLHGAERLFVQQRLPPLLAALGGGFVTAVQMTTLAEQEALRRAVLTELDKANEELRAVLNAAVDAMVLISPERVALMINRRFTEVFGLPAEAIVGKRFAELRSVVEPLYANPEVLGRLITRVASSAEEAEVDLIQVRPQARTLQLHSVPVQRGDGALLGRLHIFRDVTREREVDRREREFLAVVSHELRTPLTSIKGYADLLLAEQTDEEEQREFLQIIQHNTDRMRTLVNDLIDLSSIELGQLTLRLDRVDLSALLDGVVSSLQPQLRARRQKLTVERAALPVIRADAERLAQVFVNLLMNAHKYTPQGGHITVRTSHDGEFVRVAVADTGIGMSVEEQLHLFSKFYRARNRRTQGVPGTGLGLAITRSLVELHGGSIEVVSAAGEGSTFTVTLPVQARPVERGHGEAPESA